ncbi:hypothetical protein PVAND_001395 [Polypedilum vanderplanki]|uniref:Aminopeptidase N-like N-terminal domain-containing protein n=1 Tax=Polypedilum vanderplanki TaxID=319348 RepID=A0A9J6BNA0_POLVA|nr:hypothetical protein PVAND_001395 [Polypedilum vanderplanki]
MHNISIKTLRLSEDIKPILYDLFLHPDLQIGIFYGNVTIDLDISSAINEIAIHTHLLNISNVNFILPGSNIRVKEYWHDDKMEQLKIALTGTVAPTNDSKLNIEFSGSLRDKIFGFYQSTYKDESGNDR